MVIQSPKLTAIAILSVLTLAIGYDGIRFSYEQRFNNALAKGNAALVTGPLGAHRHFAKAYALGKQGDFKATVAAYAAIDATPGGPLQMDIKYNLANLYFRQASQLREIGADDLAMPLIELAKQNYRELLRIDSGHWDAKYNLELALVLAPEMDPVDPLEEMNPERSPNALTKTQLREPLP